MANTYVDYPATAGQQYFAFNFPYLEDEHVVVEIEGVDQTITTNYTIETSPSQRINLSNPTTALAGGELVRIKRRSAPNTNLVDFQNGSVLTESELDRAYLHNRYLAEEATEGADSGLKELEGSTNYNAGNKQIKNLADGTLATDAVNKGYVDTQIALTDTNLAGFYKSTHTGNAVDNVFTLSFTPQTTDAKAYIVSIDGLVQVPDTDYTIGATAITFNTIPANSAEICVVATAAASVTTANEAQVTALGTSDTRSLATWTRDLGTPIATGSTTARSLADRFADAVNILDFIPLSEHAAIKAGTSTYDTSSDVDSAVSVASTSKKTLFFPAGRYVQNSTINFDSLLSDVHVLGEEGTIIQRGANYGWVIDGGNRVTLENLRFDNDATATSHANKWSVRIGNSIDIKILNCTFYNGTDPSMNASLGPDGLYISTGSPSSVNNILIRDCTFDGFSRNGCSITDGVNGIKFENCLFKNCGLTGLDVEPNNKDALQVNDVSIENCSFVDNGNEATRTNSSDALIGGGLHIHSVSGPTAHISQNVKISNCYFKTNTATASSGITYFKINSGKDCIITDCIFDEPEGSSSGDHSVTLEEATFGSDNIIFKGNRINNSLFKTFNVENQLITNNIFTGANFALVSAGQGKTRTVSNNVFNNCGSSAGRDYVINFENNHIIISSNTFYDDRSSDLPQFVIDGYHTSTQALELIVANNNAKCVGADKWDYFIGFPPASSGSVDITDIQIVNNYITNTTFGINYSGNYTIPNAVQIMIQGNQIQNCSDYGIKVYRVSNLTITNNQITDCGGNGTDAIELNECTKYIVNGNLITDSRTLTDRATFGVQAFNSPDTQNALIANNVTINTQSGNSISANDAVTANNVVV